MKYRVCVSPFLVFVVRDGRAVGRPRPRPVIINQSDLSPRDRAEFRRKLAR